MQKNEIFYRVAMAGDIKPSYAQIYLSAFG